METIVVAILGSGALSTLISCIFTTIRQRKEDKKCDNSKYKKLEKGLQAVLYDRIKYLCKYHINKRRITVNDLEDLNRMHLVYHNDLEGNGFLNDLMDAVHELPVIT